jgi:hypothetical protein
MVTAKAAAEIWREARRDFSATCALAAAKAEVRLETAIGPTEVVPFYKAGFAGYVTIAIDPPEQNLYSSSEIAVDRSSVGIPPIPQKNAEWMRHEGLQ